MSIRKLSANFIQILPMRKCLLILLLLPLITKAQIITDHNLEWSLTNNPIASNTTYDLRVRYDYVMNKVKGDTLTRLTFDIKEVSAVVEGKVNTESLNGSGILNQNVSLIGGLLGGSVSNTEVLKFNSKLSQFMLYDKQIDSLHTMVNSIDSFSYYNDVANRSILYNVGDLTFGVMVTKDYGGKTKKIQNLNVVKNFFMKIGEANFIFKEIDFIEFKKEILPLIIKSKKYFEKNKEIKNIDEFKIKQ